jgi:Ubiquitin family
LVVADRFVQDWIWQTLLLAFTPHNLLAVTHHHSLSRLHLVHNHHDNISIVGYTMSQFHAFNAMRNGQRTIVAHRPPCSPEDNGPIFVDANGKISCRRCSFVGSDTANSVAILTAQSQDLPSQNGNQEQPGQAAASTLSTTTEGGCANGDVLNDATSSSHSSTSPATFPTTREQLKLDIVVKIVGKAASDFQIAFQLPTAATVEYLKRKISEKVAVSPARQRLFYFGKMLKDDRRLGLMEQYGMKTDTVNFVHLSPLPRRRSSAAAALVSSHVPTAGGPADIQQAPRRHSDPVRSVALQQNLASNRYTTNQQRVGVTGSNDIAADAALSTASPGVGYDLDPLPPTPPRRRMTTIAPGAGRVAHDYENPAPPTPPGRRMSAFVPTGRVSNFGPGLVASLPPQVVSNGNCSIYQQQLLLLQQPPSQACCLPHRFLPLLQQSYQSVQMLLQGDLSSGSISFDAVQSAAVTLHALSEQAAAFSSRLQAVLHCRGSDQEILDSIMREAMEVSPYGTHPSNMQVPWTAAAVVPTMAGPLPLVPSNGFPMVAFPPSPFPFNLDMQSMFRQMPPSFRLSQQEMDLLIRMFQGSP